MYKVEQCGEYTGTYKGYHAEAKRLFELLC